MPEIRGLTVRQPWAFAIAHGSKRVENRPRVIRYRGQLAIHAGGYARWDRAGEASLLVRAAWRTWTAALPPMNVAGPLRQNALHIDFGAIVAVATVSGCHSTADKECGDGTGGMCSPWAAWTPFEDEPGYHWLLGDVQALPRPIPCKGKLGLWRLPEDVEKAVREQLEGGHVT